MEFLKSLFESGALTFEQFSAAVASKGYKLADLSTGNYVSKGKYDDELKARATTIQDLNTQISQRDTDLANLQTQLTTAGTDNKTKVEELTSQLATLKSKYETDSAAYQEKLAKQAYEFAVREFANGKKFSSNAAKRDFINEMINQNLVMKDSAILGAEDFVTAYSANNADAFVTEPSPDGKTPAEPKPLPTFVTPTTPQPPISDNAFIGAFNFAGVRPHDNK